MVARSGGDASVPEQAIEGQRATIKVPTLMCAHGIILPKTNRGATGDHKGPHPTQHHPRPYGYRGAFMRRSGEMGLSIGLAIVEYGGRAGVGEASLV